MKHAVHVKDFTLENVSSTILVIMGTIFLFLALFSACMYFFVMAICYISAILIMDFEKDEKKKS